MIKTSLKNFGKNLIYVFIPMGIVYLFLLIAVFSLVGVTMDAAKVAITDAGNLVIDTVSQSGEDVQTFLSQAFAKINWDANIFETIKQILDTKWITTTLHEFFETMGELAPNFDSDVAAIVDRLKSSLVAGISVAVSIAVLGVILANFAARFAVRRKIAKRNFKQFVVAYVLLPIVQAGLLVLSLWLLATIKIYSLLAFVAIVILLGVISLLSSYLVYRDKTLKLKDVLTFKNILKHFAVLCIIALINIVLAVVLWVLNPLFAILLMIPIVIYSANIVDMNTDSYVSNLVQQKSQTAETAPQEKQS